MHSYSDSLTSSETQYKYGRSGGHDLNQIVNYIYIPISFYILGVPVQQLQFKSTLHQLGSFRR